MFAVYREGRKIYPRKIELYKKKMDGAIKEEETRIDKKYNWLWEKELEEG